MTVRSLFVVAALWLSLSLASKGAAEENTETRIAKLGQDLADAWTNYPSEKDAIVRKQKATDLNAAAGTEIPKLDAPENMTVQKAIDNFASNLQKIRTYFKQDKMSGERQQYASLCALVFRREISFATDATQERSVSKCFDKLVEWADSSKASLRTVPEESHQPFYVGLSEVFALMLKSATKDTDDPTVVYDRQLKEVRRKFPITSPLFQKANQPIVMILEGAAKSANSFNKKP